MTIEQAQQQVTQARAQLEQKRSQAEEARKQLQKAKKSLPSRTSQMALRQKFAGLNGRGTRRKIAQAEKEISGRQALVTGYEEELERYERESIAPVEAQIKQVQREKAAFEQARKIYQDVGVLPLGFGGTGDELVDNYLRKFQQQKELSKEALFKEIGEKMESGEISLPKGSKLDIDINTLQIKGIRDAKEKRMSIDEYNKKIDDIKKIEIAPIEVDGIKSNVLLTSDTIGLKDVNYSKVNGTGVYDRVLDRIPSGDSEVQPSRTKFGSIISDLFEGSKKGDEEVFKKDQPIVTASPYGIGAGGTEILVRPQTQEEIERFQKLQSNLLTADLSKIKKDVTDIKRLENRIDTSSIKIKDFENKIDAEGRWIGTDKQLSEYNKLVEQYNKDIRSFEEKSKIQVGLIGGGRTRDIREFDFERRPITAGVKVITATIGETIGIGTQKALEKAGIEKVKASQLFFGSDIIVPGSSKVLKQFELTPEQAGKVESKFIETGLDIGKYAIPVVGTGLFAIEGAELGGEIVREKKEFGKVSKETKTEALLFGGALLTAGAIKGISYFGKAGQEARAISKLKKAEPEIFLGFEKGVGDRSTLLLVIRRKAGRVRSETITKFDVLKTGEKTFQIERGAGIQKISKEMKFFSDYKPIKETKFTLFGEAQQVPARVVKQEELFKLIKEVKQPTTGTFGDIKLLTIAEEPQLLKSLGIGVQRTKGKFTGVISFPVEKVGRLKTGELRLIDLPSGKEKIVSLFESPIKIKSRIGSAESIGIIKKVKVRETPETISFGGQALKTEKVSDVGASIGLQAESTAFKSTTPLPNIEVKPFIAPEVIVEEQKAKVISIEQQPVLLERTDTRQIPKVDFKPTQDVSVKTKTGLRMEVGTITKQDIKPAQTIGTISEVGVKSKQEQGLRLFKAQKTKTKQKTKQTAKPKPKEVIKPKPPKIKVPLLQRLASKAKKEDEEGIEVFQLIKGKEKKTGEAVDLLKAAKQLGKGLKGGLQATGWLVEKKTGKRISGKKILPLLGSEFRLGKKDVTKIVERKEKRLRKGTTGFEIQPFRPTGSKKKKKNLFGL